MVDFKETIGDMPPTPPAKFKKGDVVEVDVFQGNAGGLFNGLGPKFFFQVWGVGEMPNSWKLCDIGTDRVQIPSCPEHLMRKV